MSPYTLLLVEIYNNKNNIEKDAFYIPSPLGDEFGIWSIPIQFLLVLFACRKHDLVGTTAIVLPTQIDLVVLKFKYLKH